MRAEAWLLAARLHARAASKHHALGAWDASQLTLGIEPLVQYPSFEVSLIELRRSESA